MILIIKWLSLAASIMIAAYLVPGIAVAGLWSALVLALVVGLINLTIKPILLIITLPINILSLGLFTLVINALLVMLAGSIVKGFQVEGFIAALLFSIVVAIVNAGFSLVLERK